MEDNEDYEQPVPNKNAIDGGTVDILHNLANAHAVDVAAIKEDLIHHFELKDLSNKKFVNLWVAFGPMPDQFIVGFTENMHLSFAPYFLVANYVGTEWVGSIVKGPVTDVLLVATGWIDEQGSIQRDNALADMVDAGFDMHFHERSKHEQRALMREGRQRGRMTCR